MKKILLLSAFMMIFGSGAFAGDCFREGGDESAAFTVYFDTGKSEISDINCKDELSKKLNEILEKKCQGIMVLGRASSCGTEAINDKLSDNRGKFIMRLIKTEYNYKINWQPAGSSENNVCYLNNNDNNPKYRSSLIYITTVPDCEEVPAITIKPSAENDDEKNCTKSDGKWIDGKCDCDPKFFNSVSKKCETKDQKKNNDVLIKIKSESELRIKTSLTKIRALESGMSDDITVWKTADGDFNTSRLISDSVAGVVLGTAGGLITSNVIKKNQISNGFEDISCAIGGQVVGGWGDEFQVGIQ